MGVATVGLSGMKVRYNRVSVDTGVAVESVGCWFDRAVGCY